MHASYMYQLCFHSGGELLEKITTRGQQKKDFTERSCRAIVRVVLQASAQVQPSIESRSCKSALFHGHFIPFAQIVDFMHCQKVCHRDLKLENFVFVDDRWIEDGGTLKVGRMLWHTERVPSPPIALLRAVQQCGVVSNTSLHSAPWPTAALSGCLRRAANVAHSVHRIGVRRADHCAVYVRACSLLQAIDFGMAAKVGSPEFQGLAGTYRYMAPEIVNDRSYDEKVDLWSVGAIMYCILAGASQRHSCGRSMRRRVKCFTSLGCSHLSVNSMWPHVNATGTSSTHSAASRRAVLTSCGTDFGFGFGLFISH